MADELINNDLKKQLSKILEKVKDEERLKSLLQEGKSAGNRFLSSVPQTAMRTGEGFIAGSENAILSGMDDASKALVPYAEKGTALVPMAEKSLVPIAESSLPTVSNVAKNVGANLAKGSSKILPLANLATAIWPTAIDEDPAETQLFNDARNSMVQEQADLALSDIDNIIANAKPSSPTLPTKPIVAPPVVAPVVKAEEGLKTRATGNETDAEKVLRGIKKPEVAPEEIDPLQSARTKDAIFTMLNALNKSLSLKDAGNLGKKGLSVKAVEPEKVTSNFTEVASEKLKNAELAKRQKIQDDLVKRYKEAQIAKMGEPDRLSEFEAARLDEMRANRGIRENKKVDDDVQKISTRLEKQGILGRTNSLSSIDNFLSSKGINLDAPFKKGDKISGVGIGGGLLSDFMLDEDEAQFRQNVSGLANQLLKIRSGAAVTDPEYARFLKETGGGNFSTQENLMSGLKKMRDDIKNETVNILKSAEPSAQKEYLDRTGLSSVLGLEKKKEAEKAPLKVKSPDMVTVYSPSGTPKSVPQSEVAGWIKRGATLEKK